ncbi:MAG: DUF4255 domain-containing protein [Bacteroidota bacterium]
MIAEALKFITELLDYELNLAFGEKREGRVIASNLLSLDGSVMDKVNNKIVVTVINLEQETTRKHITNYMNDGGRNYGKVAPPVQFNLYVLISANYDSSDNYLEANRMLSSVIGVFQAHPYFSRGGKIKMEPPLEKLTFEIFNVGINELSHIWSGIGAKYMPSIIYKIRMLSIQEDKVHKEVPAVTGLGSDAKPNS